MEVEETKATSPTPAYGPQHSTYMLNSHLPDLVNHEKYFRKQDNPESQSTLGHLGNLNPSQEYLNHLQKLQEPSQIYDNQGLPIQEKTIPLIDNQIINKQHSKSTNPIIRRKSKRQLPFKNTRQDVNIIFQNCPQKPDNYGTNTS